MSMFMPEQTAQPQAGVASVTPANPETTADDIKLMQRVLSAAARNPNLIPADFMAYVVDFIQTARLSIPIGQVFGFSQFTIKSAPAVATQETTTSGTYVDLATVGPTLSGLPDGNYVVFLGCEAMASVAGNGARMSLQVNGAAVSDTDEAMSSVASLSGVMHATQVTLANGTNTIVAKYRVDGGVTGTFGRRWMFALRYSNL